RLRPDRPGRFPACDRHRSQDQGASRARRPGPGGGVASSAQPPGWQGQGRDGSAVQGDRIGEPQTAHATRLPSGRRETSLTAAPFLAAATLALPGVAHAFFTRSGGVSEGVYASLNGGVGSRDAPEAVAENRARAAAALGGAQDNLAVPFQVHSADALAISERWAPDERPRCDALATATRGLALGVTGADCGMVLFTDTPARVI